MDITWIVILAIVTALFLLHKYLRDDRKTRQIPGPKGLPIIGSALELNPNRMHEQFFKFAQQYGSIFRIKVFDNNTIVLNSVDLVNKAYTRDGGMFNHRANIFISSYLGLNDSITFRDFDTAHRNARKAFIKSLHMYGSGIEKFESIVQCELTRLIGEIDIKLERDFEVMALIGRSIINVVSILLIGEEASEEHVKLFRDLTAGEDFFLSAGTNTLLSNLPFLIHLPYYKRRLDKTMNAKRQLQEYYFQSARKNNLKDGFVSGLIESQHNSEYGDFLTDEMIKTITVTDVLTAGTLTTSVTLPNIILCLVNHQEHQSRLQDEIDCVIGRERKPAVGDKQACNFTEAVILETLRYIPTGPFILPHTSKTGVDFEGYHIKANTQILVNLWFIHHDEKIWGDPWNFRPDRFLDENGKLLPTHHTYRKSVLMFGAGSRMCPGMGMAMTRMFLYLATLFQKYTFIPSPGKCGSCDPRTGDFIFGLEMKPKPFYCLAKKRRDVRK